MTELDREGRSPLHYAVGPEVDPKRVERLIEDGADVALPDRQGWTPLHFAAASNQAECAELLLRAGAPVDAVDMHGNTPLWRAVFAYAGDGATIAALRAAGADPHRANAHDVSPLELARRIGSSDVADVFVDADR